MASKEEFDFLNSDLWLKYTQSRYAPIEDIKYRLEKLGISKNDWPSLKEKIQSFRKMGAVPFFINTIGKKFWYFPSDSINKKIHEIESSGNRLYDRIENQGTFKHEFLANAAVEEAITSAIHEGANSTRSKAKALIASGDKPKNKDEWMLINNYHAMKWIKDNSNLPVSTELILRIHEIVTKNTLEGDDVNFCGKLRDDAVYVTSHLGIKHEGVKHDKLTEALNEAIKSTTDHPRFLHSLLKGIILHYFIAFIHPFFDGNGRTARTLFYFKGMKNNLKFVELLSVSADLKRHGNKYEKSFELVKEHEFDMTYFIDFCLDSLSTALNQVEKKVNYLIDITKLIDSIGINSNQVALLQRMVLNKYGEIAIEEYATNIGKSREIARKELKQLFAKKILKEEKKGKKFVYLVKAKELKQLVEKAKK